MVFDKNCDNLQGVRKVQDQTRQQFQNLIYKQDWLRPAFNIALHQLRAILRKVL